jgi:endonuclease/exonuclease/phosphatase family metal-dependent hydrolase
MIDRSARAWGLAVGLVGAAGCGEAELARPWTRIEDMPVVDPDVVRLCEAPDESAPGFDPLAVDCAFESFQFADEGAVADGPLRVLAFNLERGFELDAILAAFDDGALPTPDVLLASELDRGCARTGARHVARELGAHLGMDVVFGVEFVELPRGADASPDDVCEHGNALLSRFPLGNAEVHRHRSNRSWYQPPDDRDGGEPRLGGRSYVVGDVLAGGGLWRAVSLHMESSPDSWGEILPDQAAEAADAGAAVGGPAIVGGDTNIPGYSFDLQRDDGSVLDPSARALFDRGYVDAHAGVPFEERPTNRSLVIDLIFGRGVGFTAPGRCAEDGCGGLSDHRAVWADASLDP